MRCLLNTVIVCLLVGLTISSEDTYKAGIASSHKPVSLEALAQLVQNAAKANVDIFVLPPLELSSAEGANYDEAVKTLSSLAKTNKIYIASHVLGKMWCEEKTEVTRTNLVFDRRGTLLSAYGKSVNPTAACNATSEVSSFNTDFGVTFGILMPEDLVLQDLEELGMKNFVLAGEWETEIPVLAAPQFYTSWAYTTNANLISSSGIFAGKAGQTSHGADFIVAELRKNGEVYINTPVVTKSAITEDLSRYIIKPLDLAASSQGVQETVCHGQFCCQFYIKASSSRSQSTSYSLAAFDGIRHYGSQHNIGTQNCALLPCVDNISRDIGSLNNTNIIFDEVTITGNFKIKNSAQYPIIRSTDTLSDKQFEFGNKCQNNTNQVTIKLYDSENVLSLGIFGRDFSKDYIGTVVDDVNTDGLTYKIYEYINSEEVFDFFDYVWIRLRVLIFVVSVYFLEMM